MIRKLLHHPEQTAVGRLGVHVTYSCYCRSRNRHNAIIVMIELVACALYQFTQRHKSSMLSVLSPPPPVWGIYSFSGVRVPLGSACQVQLRWQQAGAYLRWWGSTTPGKKVASRRVGSDNDDRIGTGPSYYTTLQCPVRSNQTPKLSMPAHIDLIVLHGMTAASSSAPWPTHSRRASRPQRSRSSAKWNW